MADTPSQIPAPGLKDVFWRVYAAITEDRVMLIAAGVTYYLLLALISFLSTVMPADALNLFIDQLRAITTERNSTLSFGILGGLLLALWSANNGIKALFEAMNVAYQEEEKRSFLRLNLISLAFTLAALVIAVVMIVAMGVVPALLNFFWLDRWAEMIIRIARWPIMLLFAGAGIMALYRFGPSREPAKLRWLTWGAAFASLCWLAASLAVSFYLSNVADYNATYGALGALIGFMVWTWISAIIVIVGAEINAELEHQTARDSTTGAPRDMGERGAHMADTLGKATT
eukprot:g20102.t1